MTDERPDRDVAEAFDRLRSDATRVDTMDAMRRVDGSGPRRWLTTALPVAGLAAVAVALVLVFAGGSSDEPLDVAVGSESATTASEPEPPASETATTATEPEAPASETPTTASEPEATASETATTPSRALAGTSWVLVEGSTAIDRIDLGPGWPITAQFDAGSITGTAACNQYGADYALLEGSPPGDPTIEIGEIEQTEMFCSSSASGDPMETESAYLFALAEIEEWLLRVDRTELVLRGPGVELRFEARAESGADEPVGSETVVVNELAGTAWMLFEGRGPTGEVRLNEGGFHLLFGGDSIFGNTGCNGYGASVDVDAPSIELGPIESEQAGCGDIISELEYLAALDDIDRFEVSGIELVLSGPESELRFVSGDHDLMSVGELLDSRRMDPIIVKGHLVYRGGSWIVCEQIDPAAPMRCGSRWIVVVNYDRVVDPHTDPPTGVNDAAFGLAAANPAFVADGDVVYTPRPQLLLVENLGEGRYAVPEFPVLPDGAEELTFVIADLRFAAFEGLSLDEVSLADEVVLGLGDQLTVTRTAAELADRSAWELDLEAFRGRVGPFSALDLLSSVSEGSVLAGRHNHCASPPTPIPIELQDVFQLSVQPLEIDGCLEWFTVDVFIDDDGKVIGVTLDLWEP